ncbi:AraC family transcriptional regulator [Rhodococcus sp. 15-649-1-2]|nr:helix-turn-helix domain-containing protein [Rhodococcus sp. 15-649-1-2]OZE84885.1 AraC family transcriptional regulator [Rhodococcus sp. 15-649-1-2]
MVRHPVDRPIDVTERSGVLGPANLPLFDAQWFTPAQSVRDVVDTYWSVEWNLPDGTDIDQQVLEFPAVTLSIESGSVPAPFMLTNVQRRAWSRTIRGTGRVFAIRLRPAGLAVLSDLDPSNVEQEQPVTADLDAALTRHLTTIAAEKSPSDRAERADRLIEDLLQKHPITESRLLANAVVDDLAESVRSRTGPALAHRLGVSERAIQRALKETLGMGPKAIARRIRLQEVVRRLSLPDADVSAIAAALDYTDQAHLIRDFKGVAGITPGQYLRAMPSGGEAEG